MGKKWKKLWLLRKVEAAKVVAPEPEKKVVTTPKPEPVVEEVVEKVEKPKKVEKKVEEKPKLKPKRSYKAKKNSTAKKKVKK